MDTNILLYKNILICYYSQSYWRMKIPDNFFNATCCEDIYTQII